MNTRLVKYHPADRRLGTGEIYALRPPSRRWRGWWWVYAPLARASTLVDDSGLRSLETAARGKGDTQSKHLLEELSREERPASDAGVTFRRLLLVPTAACNFRCRYCFAAAGHSGAMLSEADGCVAIDHYLAHSPPEAPVDICFLGGGDPSLALPLANRLLEHAEWRNNGTRPCSFSFVTHGGGNAQALAAFALRHKVSVGISFDILPEIQERNRGHYALVEANLRALLGDGVEVGLKTTITPDATPLMERMVRETAARWPGVSYLQMEPVLAPDMYPTPLSLRTFYRTFVSGWFKALRTAKKLGVGLGSSFSAHSRLLLNRFCDGSLLIAPNGVVSACEFVSAPQDPGFGDALLGRVTKGGSLVLDGPGGVASKGRRPEWSY